MNLKEPSKKTSVAIIGTNGLPARYGGWDHLLRNLVADLKVDIDFVVYTSARNAIKGLKEFNGAKIKVIPLNANGAQSVPYDIFSMIHAGFKYDVLLVLGTSGCIFLPFMKFFGKKVILNPDGAEWKRGKWSAPVKWFLKKSESFGVRFADCVIGDNKVICDYLLGQYGVKSELIEYGGDNARFVELSSATSLKFGISKGSYAFKVCRIEPENNIDMILDAFLKCNTKLLLVGNWANSSYGRELKIKHNAPNLVLIDPIYDQDELDELRGNCGIYVHGHSVGGTNPSLVEAMNLSLYCAVFKVNYNVETTEGEARYFDSPSSLAQLIVDFEVNGKIDNGVGKKLFEIAKRRYVWNKITAAYSKILLN